MEILLTGGCDSPSAKRVLVGVDTVVTTEISSPSIVDFFFVYGKINIREVVEQQVGYSSNMISVRVRNSTGAQAG
jgi:hypothetical protein